MRRHLSFVFSALLTMSAATSAHAAAARATGATTAAASKKPARIPYSARVTSSTPLLTGLVVDQSGSNRKPAAGGDMVRTKSQALADAVNSNLEMMVALSSDGETAAGEPKFKPWFHVMGVGYSTGTRPLIGKAVGPHSTSDLAKSAAWLDAKGKPAVKPEDFAQMKWVDAVHEGYTHMGEGLDQLLPHYKKFVAENPDAPAPVVMHFTDGEPEGRGPTMNPVTVAHELKSLKTKDGHVLVFNVHVGEQGASYMFPNRKMVEKLPPEQRVNALRLFEMSSPMPPQMIARARAEFPEHKIPDDARTMVYNANDAMLSKLLEMGTVQNMQGRK